MTKTIHVTVAFPVIAALLTAGQFFCSNDSIAGGSGGETGNARVAGIIVDMQGQPAPAAIVQLRQSDYNPLEANSSAIILSDTTSADGGYDFNAIDTGAYIIHAVDPVPGTKLLIRDLHITGGTFHVHTDTLRSFGTVIVRLSPTIDTTGGYLYIAGTDIYTSTFMRIDSNICMVIDSAPSGELPPLYFAKRGSTAPPLLLNNRAEILPGDTAIVAGLSAVTTGYPDAGTTGPSAGGYADLREVSPVEDIHIGDNPLFAARRSDGWLLIEGKSFTSNFQIYEDSVIIRGCRITASDTLLPAIYLRGDAGYVVEYCEISAPGASQRIHHCISTGANNVTIRSNNFYWWDTAILLSGNDITIEKNYIHDPAEQGGSAIAHLGGGNRLIFQHNTLENSNPSTSCLALFQSGTAGQSGYSDVLVDDNWAAGGGFTFYCGYEKVMDPVYDIRFTNNKLSGRYYPAGGYYGIASAQPEWNTSGNVWADNIWIDGPNAGLIINP